MNRFGSKILALSAATALALSLGSAAAFADTAPAAIADTAATEPGTFVSLDPARVLDTRVGNGAARTPVAAWGTVGLQVTGRGGVPATGVSAVVVNVTVTGPAAVGFVTVYPTGSTQPIASNLNFTAGQSIPKLVTVKVGASGKINLRNNSSGSAHLIADVAGYYLAGTATTPGAFVSLDPARFLDTRPGVDPAAPVGSFDNVDLQVTDRFGVPSPGVAAVVANVTVTGAAGSGFITVYPHGNAQPTASNLNFTAGQTIPNLATVKVGGNGKVNLTNNSTGNADLIVDVAGYFIASPEDASEVWPTGFIFDDCGTDWDGLLLLDTPGLVYSPEGALYPYERGISYYEFYPDESGQVVVTVSAEPGYTLLYTDPAFVVNSDGSETGTFTFSDAPCAAARRAAPEQSSEQTLPSSNESITRIEGPSPLRLRQ